jgi:hypothetical protein
MAFSWSASSTKNQIRSSILKRSRRACVTYSTCTDLVFAVQDRPNNSFKPTAGVGQLTNQPSRAGGGLIQVLGGAWWLIQQTRTLGPRRNTSSAWRTSGICSPGASLTWTVARPNRLSVRLANAIHTSLQRIHTEGSSFMMRLGIGPVCASVEIFTGFHSRVRRALRLNTAPRARALKLATRNYMFKPRPELLALDFWPARPDASFRLPWRLDMASGR